MDTQLLNFELKELLMLNKKSKLEAIELLIESIADDKVYDAKASRETDGEYNELKNAIKSKGKPISRALELMNRIASGGDLTPDDTKYHEDDESLVRI